MSYRGDFREASGNFYWTLPRVLVGLLIVLAGLYGLGFIMTGGDLAIYKFWAPRRANAERDVFVNTNSYVQGKISHLTLLRLSYEQADGDQRAAIRTAILTEAAQ